MKEQLSLEELLALSRKVREWQHFPSLHDGPEDSHYIGMAGEIQLILSRQIRDVAPLPLTYLPKSPSTAPTALYDYSLEARYHFAGLAGEMELADESAAGSCPIEKLYQEVAGLFAENLGCDGPEMHLRGMQEARKLLREAGDR